MLKIDLGSAFHQLMDMTFVYHRQFRGERTPEGIVFKDKTYPTPELFEQAVDTFIGEGGEIIKNSIRNGNEKI